MSRCFSVHLDELLVVIDNVVLYGIYPHCLDCFHGCCLCSCDACWYKGQGRSMLLLFFSRKALTNMRCRMLATLHCARVSTTVLPADVFLSLRVSTSLLEVQPQSSMVNSGAWSSLPATVALYSSEIDFIRDIEHGWCNKGGLDAPALIVAILGLVTGPTLAAGLTELVLSAVFRPRWIEITTYIRSSLSVVYFDNECFVLLIQTVLPTFQRSGVEELPILTLLLNWIACLMAWIWRCSRKTLDGWHSSGMYYSERSLLGGWDRATFLFLSLFPPTCLLYHSAQAWHINFRATLGWVKDIMMNFHVCKAQMLSNVPNVLVVDELEQVKKSSFPRLTFG